MRAALTCRELIEFLDDYVDGSLPEFSRARFEHHLRLCEACVDYLRSYRATTRLALAACAAADRDPQDVPERLIEAILASRAR